MQNLYRSQKTCEKEVRGIQKCAEIVRTLCGCTPTQFAQNIGVHHRGPWVSKNEISRGKIEKNQAFNTEWKYQSRMVFIPSPSLAEGKQGLELKISSENENFKLRLKNSGFGECFLGFFRARMIFSTSGPFGTMRLPRMCMHTFRAIFRSNLKLSRRRSCTGIKCLNPRARHQVVFGTLGALKRELFWSGGCFRSFISWFQWFPPLKPPKPRINKKQLESDW